MVGMTTDGPVSIGFASSPVYDYEFMEDEGFVELRMLGYAREFVVRGYSRLECAYKLLRLVYEEVYEELMLGIQDIKDYTDDYIYYDDDGELSLSVSNYNQFSASYYLPYISEGFVRRLKSRYFGLEDGLLGEVQLREGKFRIYYVSPVRESSDLNESPTLQKAPETYVGIDGEKYSITGSTVFEE